MAVTDVVTTCAAVVTALGVFGVGNQLRLQKRQMSEAFERTFVERYERIIGRVPLTMILGEVKTPDLQTLRAFFDYFELCEEELYYRERNKISKETWSDWWDGVDLHFRRPAFRSAFDQLERRMVLQDIAGEHTRAQQFTLLREALVSLDQGRRYDPRERLT